MTEVLMMNSHQITTYIEDIFESLNACNSTYGNSKLYLDKNNFCKDFEDIVKGADVWGAIDKETRRLVGYAICRNNDDVTHLSAVKVHPDYLKNEVNAALAFVICQYYLNDLRQRYVCDGERNIRHETGYQHYLVSNLGFRYAYCNLHVAYKPVIGLAVIILYPIRNFIKKIVRYNNKIFDVWCVLKQEQYKRN